MKAQNAKLDFTGQHIFVGLDVGKKSWKICIMTREFEHRTFSQPPQSEVLVSYLKRNFPGAQYHCVYEAGYCGFWIQHQLRQHGIECIVVNPADVPTTHKESNSKSDRVDAHKLVRHLRNSELTPIYTPSRTAQENRSLLRMRNCFVRKQTRCKNQIKSLLHYYGVSLPQGISERYWSKRYIQWIESIQLEHSSGQQALKSLVIELIQLRENIVRITGNIRSLAATEPYRDLVAYLVSVPGISLLSAMILLTELIDINRFKGIDHLVNFVGLAPGQHSSSTVERTTGLSVRCNASLRFIIIECAWIAIRKDPALMMAFQNLCARMPKNRAIIRIARKLLSRIYHVWKHQQFYQLGLVA